MALGNGYITVPPPPAPFDLTAPSVAPAKGTTAPARGGITLPPAPKPFTLPGMDEQGNMPPSPAPAKSATPMVDFAKGAGKGLLSTIKSASAMDSGPVGADMMNNSPKLKEAMSGYGQALEPKNDAQSYGKIAENIGEAFVPVGGEISMLKSAKLLRAPVDALKIAGEKATLGATEDSIKNGASWAAKNGASHIVDMVKSGALKVGEDAKTTVNNAKALGSEISKTGDALIKRLESMDVQPTLNGEELHGLLRGALDKIEENPYLEDSAKTAATKMFDLFVKQLPKGKEIVAADILKARKAFDRVIASMKPSAFDPKSENAVSLALRAIRQGANELIHAKAPEQGVKDAFARQTALYDVLDNVAAKGAGAVREAEKLADAPGVRGLIARHPIISGGLKFIGAGALGALGFDKAKQLLGE